MARNNHSARYDLQRVWSKNVPPLMAAAREGATQAVRTAGRERARARRKAAPGRRRWLLVAAAGLLVAGTAGGTFVAMARRRSDPGQLMANGLRRPEQAGGRFGAPAGSRAGNPAGNSARGPAGSPAGSPAGGPGAGGPSGAVKSMVDSERVADAARTAAHNAIDREDGEQQRPAPASGPATMPGGAAEPRSRTPVAGSGYTRPL